MIFVAMIIWASFTVAGLIGGIVLAHFVSGTAHVLIVVGMAVVGASGGLLVIEDLLSDS